MSFWVSFAFVLFFADKNKTRPSGDEREKATTAQTQRKQEEHGPLSGTAFSFGGRETSVAAADGRKLIASLVRTRRAHLPTSAEPRISRSRTSLATFPGAVLIT